MTNFFRPVRARGDPEEGEADTMTDSSPPLEVTEEDLTLIRRWIHDKSGESDLSKRARIVYMTLNGNSPYKIMDTLDVRDTAVYRCLNDFRERGAAGVLEGYPVGRDPSHEDVRKAVRSLLNKPLPEGLTRWSARGIASELEVPYKQVLYALAKDKVLLGRPYAALKVPPAKSPEDLAELKRWAAGAAPDEDTVLRASMLIASMNGGRSADIAADHGVRLWNAIYWSERYQRLGLAGLLSREGRIQTASSELDKLRDRLAALVNFPPDEGGELPPLEDVESEVPEVQTLAAVVRASEALPAGTFALLWAWADVVDQDWTGGGPIPPERPGTDGRTMWRASLVRRGLEGRADIGMGRFPKAKHQKASYWKSNFLVQGIPAILALGPGGRSEDPARVLSAKMQSLLLLPPVPRLGEWDMETAARVLGATLQEVRYVLDVKGVSLREAPPPPMPLSDWKSVSRPVFPPAKPLPEGERKPRRSFGGPSVRVGGRGGRGRRPADAGAGELAGPVDPSQSDGVKSSVGPRWSGGVLWARPLVSVLEVVDGNILARPMLIVLDAGRELSWAPDGPQLLASPQFGGECDDEIDLDSGPGGEAPAGKRDGHSGPGRRLAGTSVDGTAGDEEKAGEKYGDRYAGAEGQYEDAGAEEQYEDEDAGAEEQAGDGNEDQYAGPEATAWPEAKARAVEKAWPAAKAEASEKARPEVKAKGTKAGEKARAMEKAGPAVKARAAEAVEKAVYEDEDEYGDEYEDQYAVPGEKFGDEYEGRYAGPEEKAGYGAKAKGTKSVEKAGPAVKAKAAKAAKAGEKAGDVYEDQYAGPEEKAGYEDEDGDEYGDVYEDQYAGPEEKAGYEDEDEDGDEYGDVYEDQYVGAEEKARYEDEDGDEYGDVYEDQYVGAEEKAVLDAKGTKAVETTAPLGKVSKPGVKARPAAKSSKAMPAAKASKAGGRAKPGAKGPRD
ncbi:MAG: hypothetical protein LBT40_06515 [Deltaproteobacteria bacterium]|jgi:hypothetical protein|nr:hypothetical protein [Deltaproteobacteria bacterium]